MYVCIKIARITNCAKEESYKFRKANNLLLQLKHICINEITNKKNKINKLTEQKESTNKRNHVTLTSPITLSRMLLYLLEFSFLRSSLKLSLVIVIDKL